MPFLKRSDVELYYELTGTGPPVLFIQGVGVVGGAWRPQVDALRQDFQTLHFDNRGIGKSRPCSGAISIEEMAKDAGALMETAGWPSAHVVGHSMGGVIAQELALQSPRKVRSLSLVCTFGRGKDAARLTPWVLWMTLRTRLGTRAMRRRAFLEMLWPADALKGIDSEGLARSVGVLVGRDLADQPSVLIKQVRALGRHDKLHRLRQLSAIPTLVLSAQHDPIALPRYGRELTDAIPGARFELLPRASHGVTIHQPERVNQTLTQFLHSVRPDLE